MADNENARDFEDRVDQSALDLNDLVKLMRDIAFHGEEKILGADALDALARAVERVEKDLWALKNDMQCLRVGLNKPALVA